MTQENNGQVGKDNGFDTYIRKVQRHLGEAIQGELDPGSVSRGVRELIERTLVPPITESVLKSPTKEENLWGNEGVTLWKYDIHYSANGKEHVLKDAVKLLEFPLNTLLKVVFTPSRRKSQTVLGSEFRNYFAAMIGPTAIHGLPNNGLVIRDSYLSDLSVPFRETNPPKLRRGALAITTDGDTQLLTDEAKWQLINDNFPDIRTVIGTSFYYLSSDTGQEEIYISMQKA